MHETHAEPAVAVPDEIPDTRIPYRVTPLVLGCVPLTPELAAAIRLVEAALDQAHRHHGVRRTFGDLEAAARLAL